MNVSKTYETITYESAENGEAAEHGFVYGDKVMTPEEYLRELREFAGVEWSDSTGPALEDRRDSGRVNIWVTECDGYQDPYSGAYTRRSLHIKACTLEEWKAILDGLKETKL